MELKFGDKKLEIEKNPKFLGVTLDPHLTFGKYADLLKERASKRLNMMRCIKGKDWGASKKLLLTTYKVLIRPIIDYAPFIPLAMCESNYIKVERIQRAAARIITYWPPETSTSKIYEEINIPDIRTRSKELSTSYLIKSFQQNEITKELVDKYREGKIVYEGLFCKNPRTTILGHLIRTDPNNQASVPYCSNQVIVTTSNTLATTDN